MLRPADLAGDPQFWDIATSSDVSNFSAHSSDRNVCRCLPTVPSSTGTCRYEARTNFIQDQPGDPTKAIVYAGLEAARPECTQEGRNRLIKGKALIELNCQSTWPSLEADDGFAMHLTLRGGWLYIEELGTAHASCWRPED